MAPKRSSLLALFLVFNFLFFSLVRAREGDPQSPFLSPKHMEMARPNTSPKHTATEMALANTFPSQAQSPKHTAMATPMPMTSLLSVGKCPRDSLKLGVCADVLGPLLGVTIGDPPSKPCCSVLFGLVDLEAAICLCTVIKANVLGIPIDIPIALSLLLDVCDKELPQGYIC